VTTPAANAAYTAAFQAMGGGGAGNLLSDPGFENNGQGWQRTTNGGRSITTAQAHTGTRSQQMIASNIYPREVLQEVTAAPGNLYDVSAWIMTSGIAAGASVLVQWLNASSTPLRTDTVGVVTGTAAWTRIAGQYVAPPGAVRLSIQLFLPVEGDGAGTAWFDDAAVVGQSPVVALTDGGFENNGQGWQKTAGGGRSIVTTQVHSGMLSQQMIASNQWPREVYQDVAIQAGAAYDAAGWIMTSGVAAGAVVQLLWLNGAGTTLRTDVVGSVTGTQPWTRVSGRFTAPAGAATVRFRLALPIEPDNAGTAWFDDMSLL
jgi:hypothetical protein